MAKKENKNLLIQYVIDNYYNLPKSSFNNKKIIIVKEIENDDQGWGNHSYSGIGIDKKGSLFYCYSSGCSCSGSCDIENIDAHKKSGKILSMSDENDAILPDEIPSLEDFKKMVVNFEDYD